MLRFLTLAALAASLHGGGLVVRPPVEVGMSPDRLALVDRVVQKGISAGGFPGAAVIVGRRGAIVYDRAFGRLAWNGTAATPVSTGKSIYDLASLTKVVGTTTALMVLYDEGRIRLDDKVQRYVPDFVGLNKDKVTIRMLLAHRGGLAPGRVLWKKAKSPAQAREMVVTTKLSTTPGRLMMYSDLGADLMGWVVEAASGMPLDKFLDTRVFRPLGMTNTMFRPADSLKFRIAPTEMYPPRGHPLRGEVHDENAYALGGVAGHAGLFSTASDLAIFAQMMLNRGEYNGVRIVADSTVRLFTSVVASARALGWEVGNGEHGAGDYFDEHAFGHTGFTGTSLWIDPDRDLFVVILTNRVYEARARRPSLVIADVRQDIADIAAMSVLDSDLAIPVIPASFRADLAEDWNSRARRAPARKPAPRAPSPTRHP
ncbi:MAG: serine hydrolase [Gemmatimonadaceae bacterium]|nr:serine hydrolase [Gemmatimonadaceae bacterium]